MSWKLAKSLLSFAKSKTKIAEFHFWKVRRLSRSLTANLPKVSDPSPSQKPKLLNSTSGKFEDFQEVWLAALSVLQSGSHIVGFPNRPGHIFENFSIFIQGRNLPCLRYCAGWHYKEIFTEQFRAGVVLNTKKVLRIANLEYCSKLQLSNSGSVSVCKRRTAGYLFGFTSKIKWDENRKIH